MVRGVGDDVATSVDLVDVVGELDRDADETRFEVVERGHGGVGIVGVDAVEERIVRVLKVQRLHVLRAEGEVLALDMAGGAGAPVGVGKGVVELELARDGVAVAERALRLVDRVFRGWAFCARAGREGHRANDA